MKKNILFSVIMPVYNVEPHLRKAVDSVLNQSEQNFELILVDDASPDNCPEICDELAKLNKNVTAVHHEQNQGLSMARNTGLQYAKGKYVTFMDSDDYVDPTLLENIKASLEKNPADCVVFGIREEYCDSSGTVSKTYDLLYGEEKLLSDAAATRNEVIKLEEKTFLGYAWNKFYRTELINSNKLSFEKVTLIEDIAFNIRFFENITSLNILNIAPYHYMKRIDGSLTNKFVKDYYPLHYRRVSEILELHRSWNMCNENVLSILGNIYARYIYSALQRNCDKRAHMTHSERKQFLADVFADKMFIELSPYINIGGYAGLLYNTLKKRSIALSLIFGRIIFIVKDKLPIIFAVAKQKR